MALEATWRRTVASGIFGLAALGLSACGDSPDDFSGFESSEECLSVMPIVRPDIRVDALADRCSASVGMAEIALRAAPSVDESAGAAADSTSEISASVSDGSTATSSPTANSSTTVAQTTTSTTHVTTTTSTTVATTQTTVKDGITVPDVIGLDHQQAQNVMQAFGLRNLSEVDATGDGRMLLWDRNWLVVEQFPLPGTVVDKDEEIILYSVKEDEVLDQ